MAREVRALIRKASPVNPLRGSPRIVGELRQVVVDGAESTVDKYMVRGRKSPLPTPRLGVGLAWVARPQPRKTEAA